MDIKYLTDFLYCRFSVILFSDSFVTSQHALPQNISQFEAPALQQPTFDQQTLTQGANSLLFNTKEM